MTHAHESRLPSANEFSPGQVALKEVLEIVQADSGKREAITESIRNKYYSEAAKKITDPAKRRERQRDRANNVCIGMAAYGLLDFDTFELTQIGKDLLAFSADTERSEAFAAHILKNLCGRQVLDAIRSLQSRRATVTKESLIRELRTMGFHTQQGKKLPENTTDHLILLKWLREAHVFPPAGYQINEEAFAALAGITAEGEKEIASLPPAQRVFLRVLKDLADIHGKTPIPAKTIKDHCDLQYPSLIKADRLASQVLKPLEKAQWLTRPRVSEGRGGKSGEVAATDKLINLDRMPRR